MKNLVWESNLSNTLNCLLSGIYLGQIKTQPVLCKTWTLSHNYLESSILPPWKCVELTNTRTMGHSGLKTALPTLVLTISADLHLAVVDAVLCKHLKNKLALVEKNNIPVRLYPL